TALAPLSDASLAAASPAIDRIPHGTANFTAAPGTDFFGNPRPDAAGRNCIDIGAVEFQGAGPGCAGGGGGGGGAVVFGLVNPPAGVTLTRNFLGILTLNVGTSASVTLSLTATGGSVDFSSATVMNLPFQNSFSKGTDTCSGNTIAA